MRKIHREKLGFLDPFLLSSFISQSISINNSTLSSDIDFSSLVRLRDLSHTREFQGEKTEDHQMTTERMSRNVMSLELAMQRERAHKAKIERLKSQSQSRYDAEEPSLEIKGTLLNLPDVGMKRKAPYSNPTPKSQPLACQRLREETTIREVIDDTVKRNIMPVELAMQRELANQRKLNSVPFQSRNDNKETPVPFQRSMTRVQFQPHNDSKETPVFVPGTPSNLSDVGMKRKASYDCPMDKQLPQKMQSSHGQQGLGIQAQPPVNLYCKICHVFCSGSANYQQHCRGKKHNTTLQQMNNQRNDGETAGGWPFWCDICMVPCMNEDCFQMHLAGRKHAFCAQAVKNAGVLRN